MKIVSIKSLVLLLTVCFLLSCNESQKENEKPYRQWLNPDTELEDVFTVKLNVIVQYDDVFKIYFTEDGSNNFNENQTFRTKVKGNEQYQDIIFRFPKNIHPTNFRIDFGRNKAQQLFKINNFNIGYKANNFNVPSFMLLEYFKHIDNQLSFDLASGELNILKGNDKYLPILWTKPALSEKLINLKNNDGDVVVKDASSIEFAPGELNKLLSITDVKFNIEKNEIKQNFLALKGWAYFTDIDSRETSIELILIQDQKGYLLETTQTERPDVTKYFKLSNNADNSGFETFADLSDLPKASYRLGILLKNSKDNKEGLVLIDNKPLTIN